MGEKRNTYGPKLKRFKEAHNLTFDELSEKSGFPRERLYEWITNGKKPRLENERKIAKFLKSQQIEPEKAPINTQPQSKLMLDSRVVAEMTGKQHKHLMRDIKGYVDIILASPNLDSLNFFVESSYFDNQNKERPCYLLTKQGCEMVANKMTGKKGVLFTATYVSKFNEMEQQLKEETSKKPASVQTEPKELSWDEEYPRPKINYWHYHDLDLETSLIDKMLRQALDTYDLSNKMTTIRKLAHFIEIL